MTGDPARIRASAGNTDTPPRPDARPREIKGLAGLAAAWVDCQPPAGPPGATAPVDVTVSVAHPAAWVEPPDREREAALTGLEGLLAFTAALEQVLQSEAAIHGIEVPR